VRTRQSSAEEPTLGDSTGFGIGNSRRRAGLEVTCSSSKTRRLTRAAELDESGTSLRAAAMHSDRGRADRVLSAARGTRHSHRSLRTPQAAAVGCWLVRRESARRSFNRAARTIRRTELFTQPSPQLLHETVRRERQQHAERIGEKAPSSSCGRSPNRRTASASDRHPDAQPRPCGRSHGPSHTPTGSQGPSLCQEVWKTNRLSSRPGHIEALGLLRELPSAS
jgi:hypothetical protein